MALNTLSDLVVRNDLPKRQSPRQRKKNKMTFPKVTMVIPTCYEKNQRYLDLTIRSIENLNYPKDKIEVIVVASNGFIPTVPHDVKLITHSERLHFSPAVNMGFREADPESELYMIVSDDLILTKNSLQKLVNQWAGRDIILGPISNCENAMRYSLVFGFKKGNELKIFPQNVYRYDQTKDDHVDMMNADSFYSAGLWMTDALCFFSVLIPKTVWQKIGELDENFKSGQEDSDYCARARIMGIPVGICLDVFIWHFGGVTAEDMMTDEIRKESLNYFYQKYRGMNFDPLTK